jgi:hypothetical protein
MKLKELQKMINSAVDAAGEQDVEVEFYVDDDEYEIKRMGQFSIIRDVTINLQKVE